MADTIKVRVPETLKDMESESLPFNVWLPYVQINSERFTCTNTQEVWHHFSDVTIISENDDSPNDDLNEDIEALPSGLVSWHGKNGSIPKVGDVFQVFDSEDNLLFEETISGTVRLYDREYATAEKKAPFSWESIEALKDTVCTAFGGAFKRSYDPDPNLWRISPHTPVSMETVHNSARGIPFKLTVQEFISEKECKLLEYKDGIFNYRPFTAGKHWFSVSYSIKNDSSRTRMIGWGEGTAREAALILNNALYKEQTKLSLASQIQSASVKALDMRPSDDRSKGTENDYGRE